MKRFLLPVTAALLAGVLLLAAGCSEKDVPYVIDNDVILQYLRNSSDARELFRSDSLVLQTEFIIPNDNAVYRILVDSTARYTYLNIRIDTVRFNEASRQYYRIRHVYPAPYGEIFGDGNVTIFDYYYARFLRIVGTDTTERPQVLGLERIGYFLKLGSDAQPYRGWKLWAYNGGTPVSGLMTINAGNDTTFYGDFRDLAPVTYTVLNDNLTTGEQAEYPGVTPDRYIRLDRVAAPPKGLPFYMNCSEVAATSYYRLVTGLTNDGFKQAAMNRVSSSLYTDTLATASNSRFNWNLMFMQDIVRTVEPGSNPPRYIYDWYAWCVPYRTPQ